MFLFRPAGTRSHAIEDVPTLLMFCGGCQSSRGSFLLLIGPLSVVGEIVGGGTGLHKGGVRRIAIARISRRLRARW